MNKTNLASLLQTVAPYSFPLLGSSFNNNGDFCPLNLSVHNPDLELVDVSKVSELGAYVNQVIQSCSARVAYGGYLEKRGIYHRSAYFNQSNPDTERNIHLGLDLWVKAQTPIFAPLNGVLHSLKNNTNFGDYGPTLVLEHHLEDEIFYTLYGHLSLESLKGKIQGQEIKKGDQIATLGDAEVNGTYPPHLHFQIIKDIQNYMGDYPGVSNLLDIDFYKQNCPDPNLLLNLY